MSLELRSKAKLTVQLPEWREETDFPMILNRVLPDTIRVLGWADVPQDFHSRCAPWPDLAPSLRNLDTTITIASYRYSGTGTEVTPSGDQQQQQHSKNLYMREVESNRATRTRIAPCLISAPQRFIADPGTAHLDGDTHAGAL